jgi:nucleoside-diphosphate-sugar epimerase
MQDYTDAKVLVTGAAGFIPSHLVDRLLKEGAIVTGVDDFITGNKANLEEAQKNDRFTFIEADVSQPVSSYLEPRTSNPAPRTSNLAPRTSQLGTSNSVPETFDMIFHFASPASPVGYMKNPIPTYLVNSFGTHHLAEFAIKTKARLMFASTSEVYGDPLEHPQKETYWGNVNPIGVRACYDVSKRFGEMVLTTQARVSDLDTRIVRIFNTYGPRMDPEDGRVVPNFIKQALKNDPITVHGNGEQTRSFCYVSDLVEYIVRSMIINEAKGIPINIGSPGDVTMLEFAETIKKLTHSNSEITFTDRPEDDPNKRDPDITLAKKILEYEPLVSVEEGLKKTIEYFKSKVSSNK